MTPDIETSRDAISRLPRPSISIPHARLPHNSPLYLRADPSSHSLHNCVAFCRRLPSSAVLMASTYALPLNPTAQTHHGHSRSQFLSSQTATWDSQVNGGAPTNGNAISNGHRHYKSEVNSQLANAQTASPYTDSHERSHSHSHTQSHSHDRGRSSEFSLKPFMPGRPKLRPRGESDLGRPASSTRTTAAGKFGAFSPIQEGPPPPPLPAS